jgi:hypothetical protein
MNGESPKTDPQREPKRSLAALIADVPRLLGELVRGEIESLKSEMSPSSKTPE